MRKSWVRCPGCRRKTTKTGTMCTPCAKQGKVVAGHK